MLHIAEQSDLDSINARIDDLEARVAALEGGGPPPPPPPAGGVYEVGPGKPYTSIGNVPWGALKGGDTVLLHWRPEPYRERVVLTGRYSADARLTFKGVPGPNGERPVVSGTRAATNPQFTVSYADFQQLALLLVHTGAQANAPRPGFITIEGIEFSGANNDQADKTFTDQAGATRTWDNSATGLYLSTFDSVIVRNCKISDNGTGIFTHDGRPCNDLLIENCDISGNGKVGSYLQHGAYVQCVRPVYRGNRFGLMRAGSLGNCLKDRSADVLIESNTILAGGRQVDVSAWQNEIADRAAAPNAARTVIRHNVIVNCVAGGAGHLIYVEGGRGSGQAVELARNTFVVRRDQSEAYYRRLIYTEYSTLASLTVTADRNLIDVNPLTAGAVPSELRLIDAYGQMAVGPTWSRRPVVGGGGTVAGMSNITVGNANPGYVNEAAGDYSLAADAPAAGYGAGSS